MKADEDNDAGGASLAYAWADDHLPLVVTDMSGDIVIQIKWENIIKIGWKKLCIGDHYLPANSSLHLSLP